MAVLAYCLSEAQEASHFCQTGRQRRPRGQLGRVRSKLMGLYGSSQDADRWMLARLSGRLVQLKPSPARTTLILPAFLGKPEECAIEPDRSDAALLAFRTPCQRH